MAHIVMAHIVMAHLLMAHIVVAAAAVDVKAFRVDGMGGWGELGAAGRAVDLRWLLCLRHKPRTPLYSYGPI